MEIQQSEPHKTAPNNIQLFESLQFLQSIFPKELIAMIYEYCKNLWNPFQVTCQKLKGRKVSRFERATLILVSNYLIRLIGNANDDNTYVEIWDLKEKKLERAGTLDCIEDFPYPPFSCFHTEKKK